jgi:hypothetical protein
MRARMKALIVGIALTALLATGGAAYAQRGCCSHHKGVCGCDKKTGRTQCCDGTASPSCRCGK